MVTGTSAAGEWRRFFMLPVAAALGYATSVIHIYGLGPYIIPISETFGWSRTQVTVGLTLSTLIQAVMGIPIGLAVDRWGPRRFGLIGIVLTCAAFALMGTASGGEANWYLLWLIMALATLPVQATIWTSAVATRFEASRGLAFAITLCGASVASSVFPLLGTALIAEFGWQRAMSVQALIWVVIAFPLIFLFFRGAHDQPRNKADAPEARKALGGVTLGAGLKSSIYLRLLIASLLFTLTIIGMFVNFVPILTDRGLPAMEAAGIASIVGLSSIAGRLGTGVMLDRFRGSYVGAAAFLLPAIGCLVMLYAGSDALPLSLAAALIGLTLGAEVDVIVYLTTQYFGLKSFGALYGGLLAALSIGTAFGPLGASAVFDAYGSYAPFLWMVVAGMVLSSLALLSLPRPPKAGFHVPEPQEGITPSATDAA
jgi:MFS family permease